MNFDELLHHIGEYGPYQRKMFCMLSLLSGLMGVLIFKTVFTVGIPDHRCKLPTITNDTYAIQDDYHAQLINNSIPYNKEDGAYDSCKLYQWNGSFPHRPDNSTPTRGCDSFVYDTTYFDQTVATEFDLVCDDVAYRSYARTLTGGGMMFGVVLLGIASDAIGRKKVILICLLFVAIFTAIQAWSINFAMFAVFQFIAGFVLSSIWMTSFVLAMEIVGPSKRVWAAVVYNILFPVGELILPGLAYGLRTWHHLQTLLAALPIVFLSYYWLLPESPRWQLNKGRHEAAMITLGKFAKSNGTKIPDNVTKDEAIPQGGIGDIFKSRVLRIRAFIIFYNWFVDSAVYFALSYNSGNLAGNPYLNFGLTSFVEIPSYIICMFTLDRFGRKFTYCGGTIVGGLACIASIFSVLYGGPSLSWLTIVLGLVGKLGVSAAFATIILLTSEMFPTPLRNTAIGASSMCDRMGGMVSPYLADLGIIIGGSFGKILPLLVSGVIMLIGGLLVLFLPETLNEDLPETIEEAENLGRKKEKRKKEKSVILRNYLSNSDDIKVDQV